MLLLFVPEFASQQLAGVVRDLLQPLLQGLAALAFQACVGGAQWRRGGLLVAQFAAWHFVAAWLWRSGCLSLTGAGFALAVGRLLATLGRLCAGTRLRSLAGLGGFVIFVFAGGSASGCACCCIRVSTRALFFSAGCKSGWASKACSYASMAASSSPALARALPRL